MAVARRKRVTVVLSALQASHRGHNVDVLQDDLEAHLRAFPTAPFLFVGSGMSLRYLGAENWEDLLRVFASKTAKPYERYRSEASSRYPEIATAIATEFAEVWWDDDAYKRRRADYESETTNFDSPLKIEVCEHMKEALTRLDEDGEYAAELAALKRVQVDGIITTNYDRLLETLFPDFVPFVGQSEILFSETQGIAEIYKIHGSVEKPNSLILTKQDYEDFNKRNAYLAARLLTVFVDHPVVFLGYSMSDKNVIAILQSIASGLTTDHLEKLRDRLIFIEWDRTSTDPALERSTFSIGPASIPVMRTGVADYEPVYEALAGLERNIPVRWARQMKERVFELVRTTSPVGAVRVVGIDDDKNIDDLEVVLGFGIVGQLGLRGIGRGDLPPGHRQVGRERPCRGRPVGNPSYREDHARLQVPTRGRTPGAGWRAHRGRRRYERGRRQSREPCRPNRSSAGFLQAKGRSDRRRGQDLRRDSRGARPVARRHVCDVPPRR
jgi:SIR2-like domain